MKGIRVPGERSRAVCPTCQDLRQIRWDYGRFALNNGVEVDGVMLGFCEVCQGQVLVAQQSAPLIQAARERHRRRLAVRLPRPLLDFVRMVSPARAGGGPGGESPVATVLRAMLRDAQDPTRRKELVALMKQVGQDPVLGQPSDQPVYLRLEPELVEALAKLQRALRLPTLSQAVKRALVASQLDNKAQERLATLADVG